MLVALTVRGIINYVFCQYLTRKFDVSFRRKGDTARLNGLPSVVECGDQNLDRLRVKSAPSSLTSLSTAAPVPRTCRPWHYDTIPSRPVYFRR